jgi:hypothetical protein
MRQRNALRLVSANYDLLQESALLNENSKEHQVQGNMLLQQQQKLFELEVYVAELAVDLRQADSRRLYLQQQFFESFAAIVELRMPAMESTQQSRLHYKHQLPVEPHVDDGLWHPDLFTDMGNILSAILADKPILPNSIPLINRDADHH